MSKCSLVKKRNTDLLFCHWWRDMMICQVGLYKTYFITIAAFIPFLYLSSLSIFWWLSLLSLYRSYSQCILHFIFQTDTAFRHGIPLFLGVISFGYKFFIPLDQRFSNCEARLLWAAPGNFRGGRAGENIHLKKRTKKCGLKSGWQTIGAKWIDYKYLK